MPKVKSVQPALVVDGVDTHNDLHTVSVVDANNQVLGSESFATTCQRYRQMLAWMRSGGKVERIDTALACCFCTHTYSHPETHSVDCVVDHRIRTPEYPVSTFFIPAGQQTPLVRMKAIHIVITIYSLVLYAYCCGGVIVVSV